MEQDLISLNPEQIPSIPSMMNSPTVSAIVTERRYSGIIGLHFGYARVVLLKT